MNDRPNPWQALLERHQAETEAELARAARGLRVLAFVLGTLACAAAAVAAYVPGQGGAINAALGIGLVALFALVAEVLIH